MTVVDVTFHSPASIRLSAPTAAVIAGSDQNSATANLFIERSLRRPAARRIAGGVALRKEEPPAVSCRGLA